MGTYLEKTLAAIDGATAGITAEELSRGPEGKWSAAQILEHLTLAFSSTTRHLRRSLEGGKPTGTNPDLRQRVATWLVVEMGYFPPGRKAPEFTLPRGAAVDDAVKRIRDELITMHGVIDECEKRWGGSVRIANHPIIGPFTARQWRRFHLVHTRHHMKQVEGLRGK